MTMKYYIQRCLHQGGRRKWIGLEMIDVASDLEAFDALRVVCGRAEQRSSTPSTTEHRVLDGTEHVVAIFSPNVNKLALEK